MLTRFLPDLRDMDADLREVFLEKLRVRWTHTSTALEGNTLTEGETFGVLRYGLTISGKPLAHHNEVLGHQRALDLLHLLLQEGRALQETDLHQFHTAIQTSVEVDYLKPVGSWKKEPNSTLAKIDGKTVINDTYAPPEHVASLMAEWLTAFNRLRHDPAVSALDAYVWSHATLVRIHPYADGNGRLARLVANVPVIEKGGLPILIPSEKRLEYVELLAQWQIASGPLRKEGGELAGDLPALESFRRLCAECAASGQLLLNEVLDAQAKRRA